MPTSIEKGDALHIAVCAIERHILAASPLLEESSFVIEQKKVVIVGEVRHEIDIFVTVDPASGYGSAHIFECKNWKKAVGKTEILDFSEKVRAVNAAHGYFVAKSFSRYAKAQAIKDSRITLLTASEQDPTTSILPNGFHMITAVPTHLDVTFYERGSNHATVVPVDIFSARLRVRGAEMLLSDYLVPWADQAKNDHVLHFATGSLPEGRYEREACCTRKFEAGEFILNDKDIEMAAIWVQYYVDLHRPAIISHFEVETRGRVYSLAAIDLPRGEKLSLQMVERMAVNTQ